MKTKKVLKDKKNDVIVNVVCDISLLDRIRIIEDYYMFLLDANLNAESVYSLIEYKRYLQNLK